MWQCPTVCGTLCGRSMPPATGVDNVRPLNSVPSAHDTQAAQRLSSTLTQPDLTHATHNWFRTLDADRHFNVLSSNSPPNAANAHS